MSDKPQYASEDELRARIDRFAIECRHAAITVPRKVSHIQPLEDAQVISLGNGFYVVLDNGDEVMAQIYAGNLMAYEVWGYLFNRGQDAASKLIQIIDERTEALSQVSA